MFSVSTLGTLTVTVDAVLLVATGVVVEHEQADVDVGLVVLTGAGLLPTRAGYSLVQPLTTKLKRSAKTLSLFFRNQDTMYVW